MTATLTTTLHTFSFDVTTAAGKTEWQAFKAEREAEGARMMGPVLADHYSPFLKLNGQTVELKTKDLFDNQWNTAAIPGVSENGLRVFDFTLQSDSAPHAAGMSAPRGIRRGHYLKQTPEMTAIRLDTLKCGYCGAQHAASKGLKFCDRCLDSPYLKPDDIHLTRLVPVQDSHKAKPPLTETERAELMPRYVAAQVHGETERGKIRIAKDRAKITADYEKTIRVATAKRDGYTWLMDHGINIENVIYYDHKANNEGMFSFGWRTPLSKEVTDMILDVISEFPFHYELVTDHRGTLSNWDK